MDDFAEVFAPFDKCFLTVFERQLISQLYPIIKKIITDFTKTRSAKGDVPLYDTSSTDEKTILEYKQKIDGIVKVLDYSDEKREEFLINFPKWKKQREISIEKLKAISESMKNVRKGSNIVKIAAGSIGLAGGAAIIGSILFPPAAPALLPSWLGGATVSALLPSIFLPAAPAVSSMAVAGGVAAAGGAVGNVTASIAELVLNQKNLDKTKEVIAEDRRLLEQLGVFEFLGQLNVAIEDLFGKSASSKILDDVVDFLTKIPPVLDNIEPIAKYLRICLPLILPGMIKLLLLGISLASVVLSIFFVVFIIRRRGCAILKHRIALGFVSAVDAGVEISRLLAAAGLEGSKLGELIPRQLAGKIAVGAVAGVGIVLDLATIVVSSIDLANKQLSNEQLLVLEVANKLETHLESYQSVNDELLKCAPIKLKTSDVSHWTAVVVSEVPLCASEEDITAAIQRYLPEDAWECIVLERLPTGGNHWLVKVPTIREDRLLCRSCINIGGERCLVSK